MRNKYKVPKSQWNKWDDVCKHVFNTTYGFSMTNQRLMHHPHQPSLVRKHWQTVAWNHAWIAAGSVRELNK